MKKYKYQRLTKSEKKAAKKAFYETNMGKELKSRFKRIMVYSIILIIFGIWLLIEAYMKKDSVAQYIYSIILIISGIIFIIARYLILRKKVNDYITKTPKK